MKIKNIAVSGILTFAYILSSVLLCTLVDAFLLMVLDKIILLPFLVQTIIRLVIYTAGVPTIAGFVAYYEGYRTADGSVSDSLLGVVTFAVLHALLCLLFHFHAFMAGGVRFAVGLINQGTDVSFEGIAEAPVGLFLGVFILYTAIYAATLTVCRSKGAHKRMAERALLNLD